MLYPRQRVVIVRATGQRAVVQERRFVRDHEGRRRAMYTVRLVTTYGVRRSGLFTCRSTDLRAA